LHYKHTVISDVDKAKAVLVTNYLKTIAFSFCRLHRRLNVVVSLDVVPHSFSLTLLQGCPSTWSEITVHLNVDLT